jgi:hypothetical protein
VNDQLLGRPELEERASVTDIEITRARARGLMAALAATIAELERLGDEIRRHLQNRRGQTGG